MRRVARAVVVLAVSAAAACGPTVVPAPVVTAPKYPGFVPPQVPPPLDSSSAAISQDRGWRFLQVGDLRAAEQEFATALTVARDFFPAETGLGYVALARKDDKPALTYFDRALAQHPNYVSALVGRGYALEALERTADAVAAFQAALAVDPSLAEIHRRVAVLQFRAVQDELDAARAAARGGKLDDAEAAYGRAIAASPDSAFLYRELAAVEQRKGDADRALEHFRKAASLDPGDAESLTRLGDLLLARGDAAGAATAYGDAYAGAPGDALERKLDEARDLVAAAGLPAEYRAIGQAPQVTRADLAALIGVRLGTFLQTTERVAVLITDVRVSWAAPWIIAVARAGIMEPYANHAFQPDAVVRRIDLAQAVSRLLARVAVADPARPPAWLSARVPFSDLSPTHLAYPAASEAVASGVMSTGATLAFEPSRPVTGPEAVAAVSRIEELAGSRNGGRRQR